MSESERVRGGGGGGGEKRKASTSVMYMPECVSVDRLICASATFHFLVCSRESARKKERERAKAFAFVGQTKRRV